MNNADFRKLMAQIMSDFRSFYGDNVGDFGEENTKVNYKESNVDDTEGQRTYTLDIDIWSKDSVEKENVCNDILNLLNYKTFNLEDEKFGCFILFNQYNADEREIYRTTLTYDVRTWVKGE